MRKLLAVFLALLLMGVLATSVSAQAGWLDFFQDVRFRQQVHVLDDLTVADIVTVGKLRASAQTALTVVADGTIAPTGTFQRITAAGAVGTSSIQTGTLGDVLVLYNTGANTITLTDTATLMLPANIAIGPKGSQVLISAGDDGWFSAAPLSKNFN